MQRRQMLSGLIGSLVALVSSKGIAASLPIQTPRDRLITELFDRLAELRKVDGCHNIIMATDAKHQRTLLRMRYVTDDEIDYIFNAS